MHSTSNAMARPTISYDSAQQRLKNQALEAAKAANSASRFV